MTTRRRTQTEGSDASDHFVSINERPVDDISLEFFYQPHTITLLLCCISGLVYIAFTRDDSLDWHNNVYTGMIGVTIFFMIISILAFPNGPFTRPHPALWRCVFGLSVMYLLLLQFLVHQDYNTIRGMIVWIDPKMENYTVNSEKEYGVNCDITKEALWGALDWFAFGHYWGWGMKALVIRHYGFLWSISIMWELTEMAFGHLLPNFYECWWDNLVLDVLICNGMGIFTGMQVCKFLEMREFKWESIKNIHGTKGKFRRALLQWTPQSWTHERWLDPQSSYMRFIGVTQLMLMWQVVELNTFFIKHIFPMPAEHPICVFRILLTGTMGAPAVRQYYTYITDPQCKRVGTQCWVFIMITFSELVLVAKFGLDLFSHTQISKICIWLSLVVCVSIAGVYASLKVYKWRHKKHQDDLPSESLSNDEVMAKFLASDDDEVMINSKFVASGEDSPSVRSHRSSLSSVDSPSSTRKRNVKLPA